MKKQTKRRGRPPKKQENSVPVVELPAQEVAYKGALKPKKVFKKEYEEGVLTTKIWYEPTPWVDIETIEAMEKPQGTVTRTQQDEYDEAMRDYEFYHEFIPYNRERSKQMFQLIVALFWILPILFMYLYFS